MFQDELQDTPSQIARLLAGGVAPKTKPGDWLGGSGKDQLPYEYQIQLQNAARKRALAEQLMQQAQAQQKPQMVGGRYISAGPSGHIARAVQSYLAGRAAQEAGKIESDVQGRYVKDLNAGLSDLAQAQRPSFGQTTEAQAMGPVDPAQPQTAMPQQGDAYFDKGNLREKIAKALTSPIPAVRAQAQAMQKAQGDAMAEIVKASPNRWDPESVKIAVLAGDPTLLKEAAFKGPQIVQGKDGQPSYAVTYNADGTQNIQWTPRPANVSTHVGENAVARANVDQAKHFGYGGEIRKDWERMRQQLVGNSSVLDLLRQNPAMGAGAEGFQIARKWAEALGIPSTELTSLTDFTKSQLKKRVIDAFEGKLGAQVSDGDRKAMEEAMGELGTDPDAMRRILLIESKYLASRLGERSDQARELSQNPALQGFIMPNYTDYGFRMQNPEDVEDWAALHRGEAIRKRLGLPKGNNQGKPMPAGLTRKS